MKLILAKREGDVEVRIVTPGQNIRGLRVFSIVVESQTELLFLQTPSSPQHSEWLRDLRNAFKPDRELL